MPREFAAQQQFIERLQDELNSAKEDEHFLTRHWPNAQAATKYEGMTVVGYEVTLDYSSKVWAFAEDEHIAWKLARKALKEAGVLAAFPDKEGWDV